MDLVITLLFIIVIGTVKLIAAGGFTVSSPPIMKEDGSISYCNTEDIPIGNNLNMMRESEPFTFILKQLGLK